MPGTFQTAAFRLTPLGLGATSRPVPGTNWSLLVHGVPPTAGLGVASSASPTPA